MTAAGREARRPGSPAPQRTGRIRILTANLLNGSADPAAFARCVVERRVDVVAVQELGTEQAAALERTLPHGELEPRSDFRGMGIALRNPATIRRLPLAERDGWIAQLGPGDWPDLPGPLEILNVHVFSPTHRPLRSTFPARRAQIRGLEAYVRSGGEPLALVGDLNSTPVWPLYRRLARHLDDAARTFARDRRARRPRRTWGPTPGSPRLLRIDHVFVRGLVVHHLEVLAVAGSDHSAVLVEVGPVRPPGGAR